MRSNCYLWAFAAWCRKRQEWIAAGKPEGKEPALRFRNSRQKTGVLHAQVEFCESGTWVIEQFVPDATESLKWWQFYKALWFRGHIKRGDAVSEQ